MVELEGSGNGSERPEVHAKEALNGVNQQIKDYFTIILNWFYSKKGHAPICIVEAGTQRDDRVDGHEDGLSTVVFAEWSMKSAVSHDFYSIDLSPYHQDLCAKFLQGRGLMEQVVFMLGDAAKILEAFGRPIDFAYLDAGNSALETYEQFLRVLQWKCEPALIVIDDTFEKRNASKGLMVMPVAKMMKFSVASLMDRMGLIGCGLDLTELAGLLPEAAKFNVDKNLDPGSWRL
jgi:Methyltransferase domain